MGWAACSGESMIQLLRVGWRLLAYENGASPDCIIVGGVVGVVGVVGWLIFSKRIIIVIGADLSKKKKLISVGEMYVLFHVQ